MVKRPPGAHPNKSHFALYLDKAARIGRIMGTTCKPKGCKCVDCRDIVETNRQSMARVADPKGPSQQILEVDSLRRAGPFRGSQA
jgi:hypothetical protein